MDALTQARLVGFLNQRQKRLLSMAGIKKLRDATVPLSSVADQAAYVLANVSKVSRIYDPLNQRVLYEISQQDYRLIDPVPLTGTPEAYIWTGRQGVAKQPSNASSLFVKSTSGADTTQTVYVVGVITGSYPVSASVTLTGATAVDVSAATSTWTRVDKFFLSAACAGTVTLHEDSGIGTELSRIAIGQTQTNFFGLTLWATPSGVIDYEVDITTAITDLNQDTDEPMLPEDFHDVIMLGALADEFGHLNDDRQAEALMEYGGRTGKQGRVGELLYWLSETAMGRPFGLTNNWQTPSQLGSWYPAGS